MKDKFILDACCGGRMMWFNKNHPHAIYVDNRTTDKGYVDGKPNHEVKPDMIMDFKDLKFEDKSFKLVFFDPPHVFATEHNESTFIKCFGRLHKDTWKEDIKNGFDECWRVLDDYGTLVFKWSECNVPLKELIEVIQKEPLVRSMRRGLSKTHWLCFLKIPSEEQLIATPLNSKGSQEANSLNMRYQETSEEVSQIADATSDNANIIRTKMEMR